VILVIRATRIRSGNLDARQKARAVLVVILADPERAQDALQCCGYEASEVGIDAADGVGGEPEEKDDACAFLPG